MDSPFKQSEIISVGMFADGALFVKATNSMTTHFKECSPYDWYQLNGSEDKRLHSILSLKTDEQISEYANDHAKAIESDSILSNSSKRIYSQLYRTHFSQVCPIIQKMAKQYEYIRVFYNKMEEYVL